MPQGASSGKRSIKSLTSAHFQGASASQKVKAAERSGELSWNSSGGGGEGTSWTSQISYEEPWFEERDDGWWYCNLCRAGADEAHIASSRHQKRAANPECYGFPQSSASGAASSHPQAQQQDAPEPAVPEPAFPYIAYITEDGSTDGSRWPKCLLCDKWCQDASAHSGTHDAPAGSKEHQKNLRNCWPGDPWYEENVRKVHLKWHPAGTAQTSTDRGGAAAASQSSASQIERHSSVATPNDPWIEIRQGSEFCLACNKYATGEHLESESHLRRLQYWSKDDSAPAEPWIEMRDGGHYCLACNKWATPEHLSNDNHMWRAQLWTHNDDSVPGPWVVKRDGENYCVACNKWCTEEHLLNDKHLWRVQLWAAGRGIVIEPTDVVAAVVKEVPLRGRRKGSNVDGEVIVLDAVGGGAAPEPIPKQTFAAWPLAPRVKDVLLVPVTSLAKGDEGGARPCLKSVCPISKQELAQLVKRLKSNIHKSCVETCATMVAEYYPYVKYALEHVEAPEIVDALVVVLQSALTVATSNVGEKSAVGFLADASRSALLVAVAPMLLLSGQLDSTLGAILKFGDQLVNFLPKALLSLKPLLSASYARRLQLAKVASQVPSASHEEEDNEDESLPDHWATKAFPKHGWAPVAVEVDSEVFKALEASLRTDSDELRSQSTTSGQSHSKLALKRAWRIENPKLWKSYIQERQRLLCRCYELELQSLAVASQRQSRIQMPQLRLREEVSEEFEPLPDKPWHEVNEARLLHAVTPESILRVAHEGLHPRLCAGQFGKGVHFAEDAGMCDQSHICDPGAGRKEFKDLHSRLYGKRVRHPGDVYYVLVCRVVMGHFVRANRGEHDTLDLDHKGPVYITADRHELASIPTSQDPYHSLLVEVGDQIRRYRELVQFEHARIYPEYLLAYQREMSEQ